MLVQLHDTKYHIGWHHYKDEAGLPGLTTCTISKLNTDGHREPVVHSLARCSLKDCFCKNTGRKITLQRALLTRIPEEPATPDTVKEWHPIFEKEDRKKVWEEYFKMRHGRYL